MSHEAISSLIPGSKIYFIGIGGISMSGLALLSKGYGFSVGGSDMNPSERTEMLAENGIKIYNTQESGNIDEFAPDYIVKTAAILPKNPEVGRALEKGIKIFDRSEFLGLITESYDRVINISGTHGKTTTTSMTSLMLMDAGKDPTVHLGAELDVFGNNTVRLGTNKDILVSEACEFKRSFLQFRSTTAAITNIDHDHVDCYPTIDDVIEVFAEFLDKVDDNGYVVVTGTDKNISKSLEIARGRYEKAGRAFPSVVTCASDGSDADFTAADIEFKEGLPSFDIVFKGGKIGRASLRIPGKHNIANALIAAACAYLNGADPDSIIKALNEFGGADGRYTVKGKYRGCDVVVDYAHHPTAARVTIDAASHMPHNNILVVFQPLTFNRTKLLFEDYVISLLPCRKVLFSEIFSDREINTGEISSKDIADEINRRGGDAEFFESKEDLKDRIDELIEPGDIILILGPEDIRHLGDELMVREGR
ncbi:MAG: UDP-N-acetylmuramate--L-alanine ligase [Clostridiales bacterium]|nr:UDP-N-acetylmuramate--L-alanine ligase [Clostridiales bacterium]MBR6483399.1 UDP-N-acetylmuramate--L-alanine ligase [Clostridiales bacterium]